MALDGTIPVAVARPEALVQRILAGDHAAEECVVSTYSRGVFVIAAARTHDRDLARDLTQDVLIVVLKALREGRLREPEKLAAFIQGIARNVINNYLREAARHPEQDLEGVEAAVRSTVEDELLAADRQVLLRRELSTLDDIDRQILMMSLVEGQSLADIGRSLGLSHDAVRARKSRAVRNIAKKIGGVSQSHRQIPHTGRSEA